MDSEEYSDFDSSYSDISSESDEEVSLDDARDWCRLDIDNPGPPPPRFPFTGDPGIKVQIYNSSPLEFFGIFFDDDIVSYIANETNRFASDFIANNDLTPSSRSHHWKETDSSEIRVFLAILILQGLIQKPVQKWYWSQNPLICAPFLGQIMSERRFALLMKFLHFTNNGEIEITNHPQPGLRKIYELYDALNRKFKSSYIPEFEVSVDESLLLYKGRLAFKQYIPNKRSRFGVKFYQLCEARSGYIWNSLIYTGKDMPTWQEANKYSSTTNIVMTLMENLLGQGYCLTLDNFYTSPELAEILLSNRTDVFGTLRPHRRGIPQEIKDRKLKKGEIMGFQKGKMCIFKYMDKKPICMLSTIHSIDFVELNKRKKRSNGDSEEIKTKKPKAISDYNQTMGGVDMADQCLSYYPTVRNQQKKFYKKIFRQLLNQSVWNAFVLFKKSGGTMTHLDFRMNLVESLLQTYGEEKSFHPVVPDRLTGRHFASHIEATEKKKMPTRVCVVCSKKFDDKGRRVRKESRFQCKQCHVALCIEPCFERYHTVKDF